MDTGGGEESVNDGDGGDDNDNNRSNKNNTRSNNLYLNYHFRNTRRFRNNT